MSTENDKPASEATSNSEPLYSAHIFVFPFKWRNAGAANKPQRPFHQKVNFKIIEKAIADNGQWKRFSFTIQPEAAFFNAYNEYTYFHDYARDILGVNYQALPEASSDVVRQYEYLLDKSKNPVYRIQIKTGGEPLILNLGIDSITLNFYESGVGVLAFHLKNRQTNDYKHILKINEYGRRIYPQFLGGLEDENKHGTLLNSPLWNFLPEKVELLNLGRPIVCDFQHYATRESVARKPFVLPEHIGALLGPRFITRFDSAQKGDVEISPVLDDRMFVMCFYRNSGLIERLAKFDQKRQAPEWQISGDWYRYVFVDDSKPSVSSRAMMQQLLTQATYDRWYGRLAELASDNDTWLDDQTVQAQHEGMLFGVSRYSFVVLCSEQGYINKNILEHHFSNLYFQLALLSLVQRASVLSFSAEVAWISDHLPKVGALSTRSIRNIAALYLAYIKFINKIYFREVTPQEQGLELYNKLQEQLCVKSNVEDLEREMGELHQFVETEQQSNISWITYIFLPVSIVLSFFGLNYFNTENGMNLVEGVASWCSPEILTVAFIVIACVVAALASRWILRRFL